MGSREIKIEELSDLLIQALKDDDSQVRDNAVRVLGEIKNPLIVIFLFQTLNEYRQEQKIEFEYIFRFDDWCNKSARS